MKWGYSRCVYRDRCREWVAVQTLPLNEQP